jgi:hypothetical protein
VQDFSTRITRARLTDLESIIREIDLAVASVSSTIADTPSLSEGAVEQMRKLIAGIESKEEVYRARRAAERERIFNSNNNAYLATSRHRDVRRIDSVLFPKRLGYRLRLLGLVSPGGTTLGGILQSLQIAVGLARRDHNSNSWGSVVVHNNTGSGMRGELWISIYPLVDPTDQIRFVRVLHLIQRQPDEHGQFIACKSGLPVPPSAVHARFRKEFD